MPDTDKATYEKAKIKAKAKEFVELRKRTIRLYAEAKSDPSLEPLADLYEEIDPGLKIEHARAEMKLDEINLD